MFVNFVSMLAVACLSITISCNGMNGQTDSAEKKHKAEMRIDLKNSTNVDGDVSTRFKKFSKDNEGIFPETIRAIRAEPECIVFTFLTNNSKVDIALPYCVLDKRGDQAREIINQAECMARLLALKSADSNSITWVQGPDA